MPSPKSKLPAKFWFALGLGILLNYETIQTIPLALQYALWLRNPLPLLWIVAPVAILGAICLGILWICDKVRHAYDAKEG